MPVRATEGLPAIESLRKEGYEVMGRDGLFPDNTLPSVRIGILNLMPLKMQTEEDFLRVLSRSRVNIDVDFIETATYRGSHTSDDHLEKFYTKWSTGRIAHYDGFIITGAPVEEMEFEDVAYWAELQEIMDYCRAEIKTALYICWGAQAGLYHFYKINKKRMERKLSGVFSHLVLKESELTTGLEQGFTAPHSRNTTVERSDVENIAGLELITISPEAGVHCVMTPDGREIFITGHSEYSRDTLQREYLRDLGKGLNPSVPVNYFKDDDPGKEIIADWRNDAEKLYANWVEKYVVQPD